MTYINTIEDYRRWQREHRKVFLKSRKGDVEVACLNTVLIKRELITSNTWNPNVVPTSKMAELEDSILLSGFCFPSVVYFDEDRELFVISDGEHRFKTGGADRLAFDHAPCVIREYDENQRMIATVQFNKARGVHEVDKDANIIRSLIQQGMSEEDICDRFKIDLETVMRYKSLTGIKDLFRGQNYSSSWSVLNADE